MEGSLTHDDKIPHNKWSVETHDMKDFTPEIYKQPFKPILHQNHRRQPVVVVMMVMLMSRYQSMIRETIRYAEQTSYLWLSLLEDVVLPTTAT